MSGKRPGTGGRDKERPPRLNRVTSMAESSRSMTSYRTGYTNETATQDIHTMLALSNFPTPPTSIPPQSYRYMPPVSPSASASVYSDNSSNREEILEDRFIVSLLQPNTPSPNGSRSFTGSALNIVRSTSGPPSAQTTPTRLQFVPSSPTLSARTSLAPLSPPPPEPTPPLPALPSPLRAYFNPAVSGNLAVPESTPSCYSDDTSPSGSSNSKSLASGHPTAIVRVSSPPLAPPPSASTTVVGYARAAYIPKSVATSPSPLQIPQPLSPSNLIDLRSPSAALISPKSPRFEALSEDRLSPLPGPSRFPSSPLSPRTDAPFNVPEDVLDPDDPGPSTSYFEDHDKPRNRISMSSFFSKWSRTSMSVKGRSRAPLVPKRVDPREAENEMGLPALARRAGFLAQLLDSGRLPRSSVSTYHHNTTPLSRTPIPANDDQVPNSASPFNTASPFHSASQFNSGSAVPSDTPAVESPWEYSSGTGYVDETAVRNRTSQSIRSFFTRGTTTDRSGHFNVLDEELQRRYQNEILASSSHHSSRFQSSNGHGPQETAGEKAKRITILEQEKPGRPIKASIWKPWLWKRRTLFAVLINLAMVILIIGAVVAVTWHHAAHQNTYTIAGASYNCPGNYTGSTCALDATCVCTGTGAVCSPIAVAIRDQLANTNHLMNTSYTPASVALNMWDMLGSPVGGHCVKQALLIDIAPQNADDAHAKWASAAVLWSALQSGDLAANEALLTFVNKLDFNQDISPTNQAKRAAQTFQTTSSGFTFDFDKLTITAPSVSWRTDLQPTSAQLAHVSASMEGVLDGFATSASALSTQATAALLNYWTRDLTLNASLLPDFISAVQSAPIMLPFDMTQTSNSNSLSSIMQLQDPQTLSFPPPLGCNPMASAAQLQALNSIETAVFGLSQISSVPSTFDFNCFSQRPVYGVLDLTHLRLPFASGISGAPLQAAVVSQDIASRMLIRSGAALSGYPSMPEFSAGSSALDKDSYGTINHINHVLLAFLKSLPVTQATALAGFIASSTPGSSPPPDKVFNLTTIASPSSFPLLEVTIFGTVGIDVVDHSVSSFSTGSGSLFFGSQAGNVFREWAIAAATSSDAIVWADNATSPMVVRESVQADSQFLDVWAGAGTLISNAYTVGTVTKPADVQRVIGVFGGIGYLGS